MFDFIPPLKKHVVLSLCTAIQNAVKEPISYKIEYNNYKVESKLPTTLSTSQIKIDAFTLVFEDVLLLLNSNQYKVNCIEIHISHSDSSRHTTYKIDVNNASLYISNPILHNPWSPEILKERGFQLGSGGIRQVTTEFS
jgi:hypothetical protein